MTANSHCHGVGFACKDGTVAAAQKGSSPIFSNGACHPSHGEVGGADHALVLCGVKRGLHGGDWVVEVACRARGAPQVVGVRGPGLPANVEGSAVEAGGRCRVRDVVMFLFRGGTTGGA